MRLPCTSSPTGDGEVAVPGPRGTDAGVNDNAPSNGHLGARDEKPG
jgi:hypothetical protein